MECPECKKGNIKRIDVAPSVVESVLSIATLGLGGDGGSTHYECQHCFERFDNYRIKQIREGKYKEEYNVDNYLKET